MKIALLNLPIDLNYGGNIQRYALCNVLTKLGHEVEHIQLIEPRQIDLPLYKRYFVYIKRLLFTVIGVKTKPLLFESQQKQGFKNFMDFYNKYVPHTSEVFVKYEDFVAYNWDSYKAFIVGSDQVWRSDMTKSVGLKSFFFSFIGERNVKRIAYAVSFGKSSADIDNTAEIGSLYCKFDAVSVREKDGLEILNKNGFQKPSPVLVLDPSFLLEKVDYIRLLEKENLNTPFNEQYLLTYFINEELYDETVVYKISKERNIKVINMSMNSAYEIPIPLWIKYFMYANYIVTDSYHGFVFSLIFNKPVKVICNIHGGTSRFKSLQESFGIKDLDCIDWDSVNKQISYFREFSLDFLMKFLNNNK